MSDGKVVPVKRALLSVFDKAGIADFAKALAGLGVDLISTGGTAKLIASTGAAVRDVSDLTGFPEMMDGRVKTLHPKVHGGLLAVRDNPTHAASMAEHEIGAIDLSTQTLAWKMKVGRQPAGIVVTPDDRYLMVGIMQACIDAGQGFNDGFQRFFFFAEILCAFGVFPDFRIFEFGVDLF